MWYKFFTTGHLHKETIMFEQLKNLLGKNKKEIIAPPVEPPVAPPTAKKERKPRKVKSAKEIANENNEPWVDIIGVELDPENIGNGAFELDWNDKFIAKLVRAGYKGKTDQQIVDQWFQDICRNVVLETFEQEQADPDRRQLNRRRLDNDRTEVG
jgi:hypothetical protein